MGHQNKSNRDVKIRKEKVREGEREREKESQRKGADKRKYETSKSPNHRNTAETWHCSGRETEETLSGEQL